MAEVAQQKARAEQAEERLATLHTLTEEMAELLSYVAEREPDETLGSIKAYIGKDKAYLQDFTRAGLARWHAYDAAGANLRKHRGQPRGLRRDSQT